MSGAGAVISSTLLLCLSEIGSSDRKKIGALVGVALLNQDIGLMRERRRTWRGHTQSITILYCMIFYKWLRADGKATKVALVACMHKLLTILNAILKNRSEWQVNLPAAA